MLPFLLERLNFVYLPLALKDHHQEENHYY